MADSIKIPIEIVTKEAVSELKKLSSLARDLSKNITNQSVEQTKALQRTRKEIAFLNSEYRAIGATAGLFSALVVSQNKQLRQLVVNFLNLNPVVGAASKGIDTYSKGIAANARIVTRLREGILGVTDITGKLAKAFIVLDKGLIGLALNLGTISGGLFGLSKFLDLFNNKITETIADILLFGSILAGSFSLALIALLRTVGSLSVEIGSTLVDAARKATDAFVEFDKKTFVFERTIKGFNRAFGDSIGTVESWTETVKKVSDETAFTEKALRGAVTEIVATTSAMGFNEEQQKKLLSVTSDYARFLGDDVVQTTIEFISALNGQAQSVQKYGVKLGATNLQQKLYKSGVEETFASLSEAEKVQIRWNSLLSQSIPIQGTAADVTKTLAGQQKVLENNLTRLSQAFGEGAAVIENNNLLAASLNFVLNNLGENFLKITGFLTSFVGRILQVAGGILLVSFNLLAVIKGIKVLNLLLSTQLVKNLFKLPIPLVNQNLTDLIKSSGAAFVSFKSLSDILKTFGSVLLNQFKVLASSLLGLQVQAISFGAIFKASLVKAFTAVRSATILLSKAWLKIAKNPWVIAIKLVSLALFGLYKAFQVINDTTGIFSDLWNALKDTVLGTNGVFAPVISLFLDFGKILQNITKRVFGAFIFGVSKVLQAILRIVDGIRSFSFFSKAFATIGVSERQISSLEKASTKLETFSDALFESGFQLDKVSEKVKVTTGTINKSIKKIDLGPLKDLQDELKDVGLTDLDKLERERSNRLKVIEQALKSEGEALKLAKDLEEKIELDFNEKLAEIRKKEADEEKAQAEKRLKFIEDYKKSFIDTGKQITSILGKVGQSASQAFRFAFGGDKQNILDEINLNEMKLEENLNAEIITEIEFDIEKASLDKQREDLERNTYAGIAAGIANSITAGAKGAEDMVVGVIQTGLDMLVPGLGEALGPILKVFAQGPEATKKFVKEFMEALPIIIENIILSLPAMIEAIGDNLDRLSMRLLEMTPELVYNLVVGSVRGIIALVAGVARYFRDIIKLAWKEVLKGALSFLGTFVLDFGKKLISGIANVLSGIGSFLFKDVGKLIFKGLITALGSGFNIIGSLFKKIFKFDGGGRGAVEKFLGFDFPFIAFAQGGMVGGSAKTGGDSPLNDTIPALLSAGEIVIPRSAVSGGAGGIIDFLMGMGIMPKGYFLGGLIGGFFETLAGGLGSLISGGVGFATNLFTDVTGSLGGLTGEAEKYLQQFAEYVSNPKKWIDLLRGLAKIGAEVKIDDLIKNPVDAIKNAIKGVLGFFQDNFRGLLKGGLPFAQGGMVPAGFNNDTFNARLSSGEYVIDRSLTSRLSDYLSNQAPQSTNSNMSVEILSKILSTMQKGQTINTNVEFNGDSLANIILELNRSNARLA